MRKVPGCTGKNRYIQKSEATQSCIDMRIKYPKYTWAFYLCPYCKFWHTGKKY